MYLLYLDDAGSANNKNEEYLVLGGFSVFERQVYWITSQLEALASTLNPTAPGTIEFHGSDMFSGRSAPWNGMAKDRRRQAIKDVLNVLARSHETTTAFACAVRKRSFPASDPMELAFEELCNRFDRQLQRFYALGDRQRGLIILDESAYETSLQKLAHGFRSLGTRWGILRNLAEIPLFVDSRASRGVQLADHIAYSVFRRYESSDTSYLDLILPKFDAEDGRMHGLVHKQTDDPTCMCPACMSRRLSSH